MAKQGGLQRFVEKMVVWVHFSGSFSFILVAKLNALKSNLKIWNIESVWQG